MRLKQGLIELPPGVGIAEFVRLVSFGRRGRGYFGQPDRAGAVAARIV